MNLKLRLRCGGLLVKGNTRIEISMIYFLGILYFRKIPKESFLYERIAVFNLAWFTFPSLNYTRYLWVTKFSNSLP